MRFIAVVVMEGVALGPRILLSYWMTCLHPPKAVTNVMVITLR